LTPKTGLIKGTAPAPGIYVVTVQVEEIRNGVVIAIQRKDLQIAITDCSIAAASIEPEYMLCRDTKTIELINVSNSPLINTYEWNILNAAGQNILNSSSSSVLYTFQDTGTYSINLIINKGQECSDSAVSIARVYPGFKPGFTVNGICFPKPTSFKDITTSVYGKVNSWKWDFDEPNDPYGVSILQNPVYTFPSQGTREVSLIVSNTVGCIDTISKFVSIVEKPPLDLAFKDTLICFNDSVQIIANTQGNYSWNPAGNIINANTAYPIVFPKKTTLYYGSLNIEGCINTDSVLIRVTDHVDLIQMPDTVICQNDPIILRLNSNAFKYVWTPAATLNDPNLKQPTATTNVNTKYHVVASIGSCKAAADINVKTVPYPIANAGKDTIICYNSNAQLKGTYTGSILSWSPTSTLSKSNISNPLAHPFSTTEYVFTVFETLGCPKPSRDTVLVTVLPPIKTFAGNDTIVVTTQPLQLHGTGGENFTWSPGTYLSATNIPDPLATFPTAFENIKLKLVSYNEAGCADSAYINIKVYNTLPKVFVPTAFTPNSDGKNDKLRPIAVGIKKIETFNIYNRWGEMIYSSPDAEHGWDGTVKGLPQPNGVFAWMVKAIDFTGKAYIQKGTVVLIR
jgi:gliding motility-associated-like protein